MTALLVTLTSLSRLVSIERYQGKEKSATVVSTCRWDPGLLLSTRTVYLHATTACSNFIGQDYSDYKPRPEHFQYHNLHVKTFVYRDYILCKGSGAPFEGLNTFKWKVTFRSG